MNVDVENMDKDDEDTKTDEGRTREKPVNRRETA